MGRTEDLSWDLENWMGKLPEPLKAVPIIHLAIPGSHDSGSCTITPGSAVSPDSMPVVRRLAAMFGSLVKRPVYRWSVTQHLSISEQLAHGIRYLDLRVASRPPGKELYVVHGMYGCEISSLLSDVRNFLVQRPDEVVILDLQHFYRISPDQHSALMGMLARTFGAQLCPLATTNLYTITLHWLRTKGYQEYALQSAPEEPKVLYSYVEDTLIIWPHGTYALQDFMQHLNPHHKNLNLTMVLGEVIVLYRNSAARGNSSFWPSGSWPTPWPDTTSIPRMLSFLEEKMASRMSNSGLVTQCILTPDVRFVLLHLLSDLQSSLSRACNAVVQSWLQQQEPGPKGINVVIYDFVGSVPSIVETVVQLNYKMMASGVKN